MIPAVVYTALGLSVLSFLAFAAITIRLLFTRPAPAPAPGGAAATAIPHAAIADTAKLVEAMAKLTDAFAKAGPAVMALVASLMFLLVAAFVAVLAGGIVREPPTDGPRASVGSCTISHFEDGSHQVPGATNGRPLGTLVQNPDQCVDYLVTRAGLAMPALLLVVGKVDRRELRPALGRIYGGNLGLAYQRALVVRQHMTSRLGALSKSDNVQPRILALTAGPGHIDNTVEPADLAQDRAVEIVAYWVSADGRRQTTKRSMSLAR